MASAEPRPTGDPSAPWWTYADIAHRAGLAEITARRRMPEWERAGFPCPLPHSKRQLRWHTRAVLAWFERIETAARACPPQFGVIQGGRR